MHHTTVVGPVLDENDKPVPGVSFHVKGVLESNHAGQLLSDDQFAALVVDDIELTRTTGGGFEYSMELVVSEAKLAAVQAANAKAAADKLLADTAATVDQQKLQHDQALKDAFEAGKKQAELDAAKAAGAASVSAKPAELPPPSAT